MAILVLYWRYGDIIKSVIYKKKESSEINSVETTFIKKEKYNQNIPIYGTFEPSEMIEVSLRYSGVIEKYYIEEGDFVKKNQILLKIDTTLIQQEIEKLQAGIVYLESQVRVQKEKYKRARKNIQNKIYEHIKMKNIHSKFGIESEKSENLLSLKTDLYREGVVSGEEIKNLTIDNKLKDLYLKNSALDVEISSIYLHNEEDHKISSQSEKDHKESIITQNTSSEYSEVLASEASLRVSQLNLKYMREMFRNSNIISPCDGRILKIKKNSGEFISANSGSIISLGVVHPLKATFTLGEKDSLLINKRDKIKISTENSSEEFEGEISGILPLYEERAFSTRIKAIIPNPQLKLHPGIFFRGKIELGIEKERSLLLSDALIAGEYVYILKENQAVRQKVEAKILDDNYVEILSGLTEKDEVLLSGNVQILEGQKIRKKSIDNSKL